MANVVIQRSARALDINALNRSGVYTADLDNGSVMRLDTQVSVNGDLWTATLPTTGNLTNLYMAYSPEVVVTAGKYKGIDPDPRNFVNVANSPLDFFKPEIGDIITMTTLSGTQSTNQFVVATNGASGLTWSATAPASTFAMKLIGADYIDLQTGSIGVNKVSAFKFEVVAN